MHVLLQVTVAIMMKMWQHDQRFGTRVVRAHLQKPKVMMQEPCTGEDGAGKEDGVVAQLAALKPQDQPRCSHQRRRHDQQRHPCRKRARARAHDEERRSHSAGKAPLHCGRQHTC